MQQRLGLAFDAHPDAVVGMCRRNDRKHEAEPGQHRSNWTIHLAQQLPIVAISAGGRLGMHSHALPSRHCDVEDLEQRSSPRKRRPIYDATQKATFATHNANVVAESSNRSNAMARGMCQVLVLPFRRLSGSEFEYACLQRSDDGSWQGIAGGLEEGESPIDAAVRESNEEAGIPRNGAFYTLDSTCSIPVIAFAARVHWPDDVFVIPELSFAVDCTDAELRLSREHTEQYWGPYATVRERLRWDSNRTALWELNERLRFGRLGSPIRSERR
jgi:dATP pyrophosphohydrolase